MRRPRRKQRNQMMPEHQPEMATDHLDIDAVNAFIDRDLPPDILALFELHLSNCPACHREVLEVHSTVLLLRGLPQYAPRRQFTLGQEHARAGRRRPQAAAASAVSSLPLSPLPAAAAVLPPKAPRGSNWLPGLQVAAMVAGVLLLLISVGDLARFAGRSPELQLAAPTAAAGLEQEVAEAPAAMPAPADDSSLAAFQSSDETRAAPVEIASDAAAPARKAAAVETDGTNALGGASDGVQEGDSPEQVNAEVATSLPGAAAITQVIPTLDDAANSASGTTSTSTTAPSSSGTPPSRLRIVQLGLAVILAWLLVSIVGLRWVRRLR